MNLVEILEYIDKQTKDLVAERNEKILEIRDEYEKKIQALLDVYNALYDMNTACLECKGTGKVEECDNMYEARYHTVNCAACDGTGRIKDKKG